MFEKWDGTKICISHTTITTCHHDITLWNKSFNSEKNSANSDSIKNNTHWMSRFEFQNKICNLSLDLEDRLYLAFTKQIRLLYEHWYLVTHCYCSELPRSSSNLVKKTMILYDTARILSPDFLKSTKFNLSSKSNDKLQIFFWNSNLLILWVLFLTE